MIKSLKTIMAALGALSMAAIGTGASAAPANSTVPLNIRTGPGIGFVVVDTLLPGETVEVTECVAGGGGGWCRIMRPGPNGWVSSRYLIASSPGGAPDPNCNFGLSLGPGGPKFSINCGGHPVPPAPPAAPPPVVPMPSTDIACMYTGSNFSGAEFCLGPSRLNTLNGTFNNRISSVRLFGNTKVKLCRNTNLGGLCRNFINSRANLGGVIDNRASSLAVYTGAAPVAPLPPLPAPPAPPMPPVTFSTGGIILKQTFTANLDNGTTGGDGADIWYQAVNAVEKYVSPRNGARISLTNGAQRGYAGCSVAGYSSNRVPLARFPVGTYVCVKTNQGRISEFRVNGYTGTTMKIGFTTWAN